MQINTVITIATLMVQPLYAQHSNAAIPGVTRTDLQRHDISIPGQETIQSKVEIEPGARFPRHTHPGEEVIYVLNGTLEYQIEDEPPKLVGPGGVLFIPAGKVHSVRNTGYHKGSELGTYIVEKGKPLVTIVE